MLHQIVEDFMGLLDWLHRKPAPIKEHRVFGRVRASHREPSGLWLWEALSPVESEVGALDITFDADEAGPAAAHEAQFSALVAQANSLTRSFKPALVAALSAYGFNEIADDDLVDVTLEGVHLTGLKDCFELGYRIHAWAIAYINVTCNSGKPAQITIDT